MALSLKFFSKLIEVRMNGGKKFRRLKSRSEYNFQKRLKSRSEYNLQKIDVLM